MRNMPQINKRQIKEKPVKYKKESTLNAADHYGSMAWRRLRDTYISLHPLCEECLKHGVVKSADEVHHMLPWSRGENEQEQWELFLNEKNLMSLCSKCHTALHCKDNEYHLGRLDDLTETEYNYAHCILK